MAVYRPTPANTPDDSRDLPEWDGLMDIGLWKIRRRREIKIIEAKKSPMLKALGKDGQPLYKLNDSGNLIRTKKLSQSRKNRVKERDGWKCTECGHDDNLEVHHIIRYIDGGSNDMGNLATLCHKCHGKKGGR